MSNLRKSVKKRLKQIKLDIKEAIQDKSRIHYDDMIRPKETLIIKGKNITQIYIGSWNDVHLHYEMYEYFSLSEIKKIDDLLNIYDILNK